VSREKACPFFFGRVFFRSLQSIIEGKKQGIVISLRQKGIILKAGIAFIDSHVHLDLLYEAEPSCLSKLRRAGCLPVSWAFGHGIQSTGDLETYLHSQAGALEKINREVLPCFFLSGIHPRNIPADLRPEDVERLLLPFLDHPLCLGIGEIGLENADAHEKEIFSAQLALAPEMAQRGKVFGVHTPKGDKIRVSNEILEILKGFTSFRDRIIVDHCTIETIDEVLRSEFWAGMTLSPAKSSVEDLQDVARRHVKYLDRIMLNTDSGDTFYDDLLKLVQGNNSETERKGDLTRGNACRFFGIPSPPG